MDHEIVLIPSFFSLQLKRVDQLRFSPQPGTACRKYSPLSLSLSRLKPSSRIVEPRNHNQLQTGLHTLLLSLLGSASDFLPFLLAYYCDLFLHGSSPGTSLSPASSDSCFGQQDLVRIHQWSSGPRP